MWYRYRLNAQNISTDLRQYNAKFNIKANDGINNGDCPIYDSRSQNFETPEECFVYSGTTT